MGKDFERELAAWCDEFPWETEMSDGWYAKVVVGRESTAPACGILDKARQLVEQLEFRDMPDDFVFHDHETPYWQQVATVRHEGTNYDDLLYLLFEHCDTYRSNNEWTFCDGFEPWVDFRGIESCPLYTRAYELLKEQATGLSMC